MSNLNKNRNTFKIGALLLVVCLISTVMLSGTFAKYTSEYAGADTALVARWSFTSTNLAEATAGNIYLPIWDHNYSTNIVNKVGSEYLIAPGIQGQFTVDFTYDADVDAQLIFNFTKSGDAATSVPIQYALDDFTNSPTVYYSLDALEDAIIATALTDSTSEITWETETDFPGGGTYRVTDTATAFDTDPTGPISIEQTVYWRWPYDVSAHNALTAAGAGVAADRTAAGFTGTGEFPEGTPTLLKAWTDVDDTAIGNSSVLPNRDSYVLNLQIKATQLTP